jgi:hypothetical protein
VGFSLGVFLAILTASATQIPIVFRLQVEKLDKLFVDVNVAVDCLVRSSSKLWLRWIMMRAEISLMPAKTEYINHFARLRNCFESHSRRVPYSELSPGG